MNTYERLLAELVTHGVEFATVGGVACAFNGWLRATLDVDILVKRTPANLTRLLDVLSTIGAGAARQLTTDDFTDEPGAIRIIEDFPIDVFTRVSGFTYEAVTDHIKYACLSHEEQDVQIPYVDAATLRKIKSASAREQDILDVQALTRIINVNEDTND